MKYYLSTAGRKCCKGCTWLLSLAQNEAGYDLIQFKRGLAENRNLMKLYPGEPAIVLDTGEFYIGDATGRPILINPNGAAMPQSDAVLCTVADPGWVQGDSVEIAYEAMITSDASVPDARDAGKHSCIVLVNGEAVPIGIGFILDWVSTAESASAVVGFFNQTTEFTPGDIDMIMEYASAPDPVLGK